MRATNNTRETVNFLVKDGKVKDGVPETCSLAAGETANLDVDVNDPQVRAAIWSGQIAVADSIAERVEAAVAAPAEPSNRVEAPTLSPAGKRK